jgi:hypothetical protein
MQNWGERLFKLTIGKESLHQDGNDNGVGILNFATKDMVVTSMCSCTETFLNACGPPMMGRPAPRLIIS